MPQNQGEIKKTKIEIDNLQQKSEISNVVIKAFQSFILKECADVTNREVLILNEMEWIMRGKNPFKKIKKE